MRSKILKKMAFFTLGLARFLTAILLIFVLTLTILSRSILQSVTSLETYQYILQENNVAERSKSLAANLIFSYFLSNQNSNKYLQNVSVQNWESIAETLLPDAWYAVTLNSFAETMVAWLNGNSLNFPESEINLRPIKIALRSPDGVLAILPLLQDVEVCPDGVHQYSLFNSSDLISCIPGGVSLTIPARLIANTLADTIQEKISLGTLQADGMIAMNILEKLLWVRNRLSTVNSFVRFLEKAFIFLLLFYGLLNSSSFHRLFSRIPIPLYISAGMILLAVLAWHFFTLYGIEPLITSSRLVASVSAQKLIVDSVQSLTQYLERDWIPQWLGLLGVGVVVQIIGITTDRWGRRKDPGAPLHGTPAMVYKKQIR